MRQINHNITDLLSQLVKSQAKATGQQLALLKERAATAPFADNLLEVDQALWGGFWHFDVIAPGYRLPAVELALLRAIRLDHHWPEETTVTQFVADLRQAILHPSSGIWTLAVASEPCIVFAAPQIRENPKLITVAWHCAATGRLHAGYRTSRPLGQLANAIEQHPLSLAILNDTARTSTTDWLSEAVAEKDRGKYLDLAARLDSEILRLRLG